MKLSQPHVQLVIALAAAAGIGFALAHWAPMPFGQSPPSQRSPNPCAYCGLGHLSQDGRQMLDILTRQQRQA